MSHQKQNLDLFALLNNQARVELNHKKPGFPDFEALPTLFPMPATPKCTLLSPPLAAIPPPPLALSYNTPYTNLIHHLIFQFLYSFFLMQNYTRTLMFAMHPLHRIVHYFPFVLYTSFQVIVDVLCVHFFIYELYYKSMHISN